MLFFIYFIFEKFLFSLGLFLCAVSDWSYLILVQPFNIFDILPLTIFFLSFKIYFTYLFI